MNVDIIKNEQQFSKIKDKYCSLLGAKDMPLIMVLTGSEHLFKKTFIKSINSTMFDDKSLAEINSSIFYDKNDALEANPLEVAETMPFISERRLVVVYEYSSILGKNDFEHYIKKPSKYSIVILATENDLEKDNIYNLCFSSKSKNKENIDSSVIAFIDFPKPKRDDFVLLIKEYIKSQNKNITTDALEYILDNMPLDYEVIKNTHIKKIFNMSKI